MNVIILHGRPGKDEYYSDKFPSAGNTHRLPWLNPQNIDQDDFFDFKIDPDLASPTASLTIFNSDDATEDANQSVSQLQKTVKNVKLRGFHGCGHFTLKDLGGVEFPVLLKELL